MNAFNSFPIQIKKSPSDVSTDSIQKTTTNNGSLVARGLPLVRGKRELRAKDRPLYSMWITQCVCPGKVAPQKVICAGHHLRGDLEPTCSIKSANWFFRENQRLKTESNSGKMDFVVEILVKLKTFNERLKTERVMSVMNVSSVAGRASF